MVAFPFEASGDGCLGQRKEKEAGRVRIKRLKIERFGALSRTELEPGDGITLICGPNEAGKSTWMNFIRFALFGFPPRTGVADKYIPIGGGAYGGTADLIWPDGYSVRIDRTETGARGSRSAGYAVAELAAAGTGALAETVAGASTGASAEALAGTGAVAGASTGAMVGISAEALAGASSAGAAAFAAVRGAGRSAEAEYAARLGPVDGALYRRWFAIGLGDLQQLGTLREEAIGRFMQGAGWGGDGWAAAAAEERLQAAMDKLYRPRGQQREINATLAELEAARREFRAASEALGEYNAAVEEGRKLDREIEDAESRLTETRRGLYALEREAEAYPHAVKLMLHRQRLAELGSGPDDRWPADAAERLGRLSAAAGQAETELRRAEDDLREAEDALAALPAGDDEASLPERRAVLESLLAEAAVCREQRDRAAGLEAEERQLTERLAELLAQAGPGWTEERLREQRADIAAKEAAREARDRLAAYGRELEQAAAECDAAERAAAQAASAAAEEERAQETLDEQLAALDESIGAPQGDEAAAELWASLAAETADWRRWSELAEAREQLAAQLAAERERLAAEAHEQRAAQAALLRRLAAALGAGGALAAAAAAWADAWPAAGGALALAAGAAALLWRQAAGLAQAQAPEARTRRGRGRREPAAAPGVAAADAGEAAAAAERLARRLAPLARAAGEAPAAPLQARLAALAARFAAAAERRAQLLREREAAAARVRRALAARAAAQQAAAAAASRRADSAAALAAAADAWRRGGAAELGLGDAADRAVSPEAALDLMRLAESAQPMYGRRGGVRAERERLAAQVAGFERRAAAAAGLAAPGEDAAALLRRRKAELDAADALARKRELLAAARREREAARSHAAGRLAQHRNELAELLAACGVSSEEELRRSLSRAAEWSEERRAAGELESLIASLVGPEADADKLARRQPEELLADAETARETLQTLEGTLRELRERKGERRQAADELKRAAEQTDRRQRLEELSSRLGRQAGVWAVQAMATALLRDARAVYERDRQPDIMRRASRMFAEMTEGRYRGVIEAGGQLAAVHPDGERVDPARLSRGTAEQLLLAIRFGLAEHLAEARGLPMPLVLDDLFVNFDPQRTAAALQVLQRLSTQMQVLMFTCHPHVRDLAAAELGSSLHVAEIGRN